MGLDINSVLFMLDARKRGVSLGEMLTIGRQHLNVYPAKMVHILRKHGLPWEGYREAAGKSEFGEPCLRAIGATHIYSIDASDFEGADFVHDLNKPLPRELANRFDTVFDGGTLEHVFNFPVAIRNCMEMLRVGGHFFMHTCANNLCGHGFYQFSPELFYRIFSEQNGFAVERVILHRIGPYNRWYEVPDPNSIRSRIELITFTPIQMMVQARKTKAVEVFASAPQQSDYTVLWQQTGTGPPKPKQGRLKTKFQSALPGVARVLHVIKTGLEFYKTQSLWNRRCFRPVKKP
jgi:SAM-dependent methyltransferase